MFAKGFLSMVQKLNFREVWEGGGGRRDEGGGGRRREEEGGGRESILATVELADDECILIPCDMFARGFLSMVQKLNFLEVCAGGRRKREKGGWKTGRREREKGGRRDRQGGVREGV
jgi:hypothetical protein